MVRIEMNNGCMMFYDAIAIHNIYSVDIDEEEKSIEFNDSQGFVAANISDYSDVEEIGFVEYDVDGNLKPFEVLVIENGKMTYKKGDENYDRRNSNY